jgi:uncharacterized iron-regulated protein
VSAVRHHRRYEIICHLHARLAEMPERGPLTLGMEMFEADVQPVLDEFLAGLLREQEFCTDARCWSNYAHDYAPMVNFAKANGLRVIASNAPVITDAPPNPRPSAADACSSPVAHPGLLCPPRG